MKANRVSAADLTMLEAAVSSALVRRDHSGVNILGFGEISVALGFPERAPHHVCKRTPPFTPEQFERYRELVIRYLAELRSCGLTVLETEVMSVERGGRVIGYLVQPLLPADSLGHKVLAAAEPDAEHPFLVALAETVELANPRLSIDAQVTNWSWDGAGLTLIDVGTPFLWDESGALLMDMGPFLAMIPSPLRRLVGNDMAKLIGRWQEPRGVAVDLVANLFREGLEHWVPPALVAMNRSTASIDPIPIEEARSVYEQDLKTWPRLTRLKRLERAWQTRIRRRPYDFFVQSTFVEDRTY